MGARLEALKDGEGFREQLRAAMTTEAERLHEALGLPARLFIQYSIPVEIDLADVYLYGDEAIRRSLRKGVMEAMETEAATSVPVRVQESVTSQSRRQTNDARQEATGGDDGPLR